MASLKRLPDDHDLGHLRRALALFDGRRVAVDGGANRGIWTRALVAEFDEVHAFEPVAVLAAEIPCGVVHAAGLGERAERTTMRPGPDNDGQWHVAPDGVEAEIVPLDSFGIAALDFLKLDVEGYELAALHGAKETVQCCRPAIMVEQNGLSERYGHDDTALVRHITSLGYACAGRWNKDYLYLPA